MKTGHPTELFMPLPYEVRDLTIDKTATRPTLWIPAYRPPSKLVKVQVWWRAIEDGLVAQSPPLH
jgi:hypothetical protein